ncbi:hypothetical protein PPERSA_11824 [Pseudocohnilembus persalinus]|uniref:Ubiquitin carboxyl-terminal hydrolase n=1 Tax=Pseudocohnilembus persalinus TaxID=266149 RepID=A0A0V0QJV1_PSEPJ|nr:hypothetical protein PPERSA_11824 [Pseudocohnilembus persalinus]|eukprot:KRX02484.1 hypothetical protein PPERSA_11824 [Pseudocohnilembus persalinus]
MIRQNSNPSKEQQKEFKKLLPLFQDFGFGPEYVWDAFKFTNGNPNEMLNLLVEQSKVNNEINQKLSQSKNPDSEQNQIKEAIKQSLQQQQNEDIQNPEELIRKPEFPVGLQNLGQTCYFNVVIQTLFQIREVRDLILKIDFDQIKHELYPLNKQKKFKLLKEFQILFGMMLKGKKSYTIPLELFEAFKSINDNVFKIGEQADFFEFQNTCFELIEEAFDTDDQQQIEQKQKQENTDQELNNGFNQSILKKSQIQEKLKNNKNPITKLFYGVSQEVIQFYVNNFGQITLLQIVKYLYVNIEQFFQLIKQNNQQAEIKKYQEQIQGIVNLDVKLGDLYKSFSNSQKIVIDEYQTKDGNKTSAQIDTKIKTPPYILNFYINRMSFNRKTLQPEKDQSKFYFPKEMFLDLFMQQESEQNQQNSYDNLQIIERKIQKLEEVLQNWEEYGEYNLKLEHCFTNVLNFLKLQRENEEEFTNLEESEVLGIDELEGKFGVLGNVNDFKTTINTVQNYHDQLKNKKQKLQEKLKILKEQKKKMYEQNQNQKYELFSILMHDGEAMSGHYYCYILDDKTGEWWKFNDRIVTKANEQEIFEEAYGNGNSKKNACCLFYRNAKEKIKNTQPVTLTARLKQEIVKRDRQFLEDIDITRVQNGLEGLKINMGQIIKRHQKILDSPNKSFIEKFADFDRFLLNEESFKKFSNYSIFSKLLKNANTDQVLEVLNSKQNLEKAIIE